MESVVGKLERKLREGKPFTIKVVAETLVSGMRLICDACQRDKIRCAFDPMCKNRNYLSLLIESGVPEEELPRICFNFRKAEVQKFYMRKPIPVSLRDAKIPLKTLKQVFKLRSSNPKDLVDEFVKKIKPYWARVDVVELGKGKFAVILEGGRAITVIDFSRGIVNVDAREDSLAGEEVMRVLASVASSNGFDSEFFSPYSGRVMLLVRTNAKAEKKTVRKVIGGLQNMGVSGYLLEDGEGYSIAIEVGERGSLIVGEVPEIILKIKEILEGGGTG